jgi:hypothetical protein
LGFGFRLLFGGRLGRSNIDIIGGEYVLLWRGTDLVLDWIAPDIDFLLPVIYIRRTYSE